MVVIKVFTFANLNLDKEKLQGDCFNYYDFKLLVRSLPRKDLIQVRRHGQMVNTLD